MQLTGPALAKLKGAQIGPTWWRAVKLTPLTYGLHGYVHGSKRPASDCDAARTEADIKARGILLGAIDETLFTKELEKHIGTSKELNDKLCELYGQSAFNEALKDEFEGHDTAEKVNSAV